MPVTPDYVLEGEDSHDDGMRMPAQLLDHPDPPSALFAASDLHALGALQVVGERGLRMGTDLAIVGFDDSDLAGYMSLTTVRQPMVEMGRRGFELLLDRIDRGVEGPEHIVLPVKLVVRRSTKPLSERSERSSEEPGSLA